MSLPFKCLSRQEEHSEDGERVDRDLYQKSARGSQRGTCICKKASEVGSIDLLPTATQTTKIDPSPLVKAKVSKKSFERELPPLDAVIAMTIDSISWGDFHRMCLLDTPAVKNRENANVALTAGKAMGIPVFNSSNPNASGWDYGNNKNFMVKHPKP